ncbi:MAG: hypothetical protein HY013_17475, partial [Candidatus Solibacter usitatus]|nr:hypothetical protein [Candidatus Solibacter usitatus]
MRAWLLLALVPALDAQRLDPAQWSMTLEPAQAPPGAKVLARVAVAIEPGWHLYSMSTPKPSIPTTLRLIESPVAGSAKPYQRKPTLTFDPNFGIEAQRYD